MAGAPRGAGRNEEDSWPILPYDSDIQQRAASVANAAWRVPPIKVRRGKRRGKGAGESMAK
ncbi:MAG TPA: hypothetical protein VN648_10385, partial [Candidatus Methylomirabilis sp.]|nr:hypothetical protein [Candidatus Methylomirabilis sp.]